MQPSIEGVVSRRFLESKDAVTLINEVDRRLLRLGFSREETITCPQYEKRNYAKNSAWIMILYPNRNWLPNRICWQEDSPPAGIMRILMASDEDKAKIDAELNEFYLGI